MGKRFECRKIVDDYGYEIEAYVDLNSVKTIQTPYGPSSEAVAFRRQVGRYVVGGWTGSSNFISSDRAEVYYDSLYCFDGSWLARTNAAGGQVVVTKDSGTGRLFSALENFHESLNNN